MISPLIDIRGVEKSYGRVPALNGLTVAIQPGAVGLLGPNGAGKTTLLKILLGLLRADRGSLKLAGLDPAQVRDRLALRKVVGYMPESDCLLPSHSAVDLVTVLGRLAGMSFEDAMTRSHEVLDYVGVEEARYRRIQEYSTGMKQRVKLAQALVHDPPFLLLDEPTNGLDPKGRRHMLDLIWDLGHARGKSILLCSHLLPDVERTCRDVVLLKAGRVALSGAIDSLTQAGERRLRLDVTGDVERFLRSLVSRGYACTTETPARISVSMPADRNDADPLFECALESGAVLRELIETRSTLEEVMLEGMARSATA